MSVATVAHLAKHTGALTIASSTANEKSVGFAPGTAGNSAFTAELLRAIQPGSKCVKGGGLIFPMDVWTTVAERMAAKRMQTPVVETAGKLELWPLGKLDSC